VTASNVTQASLWRWLTRSLWILTVVLVLACHAYEKPAGTHVQVVGSLTVDLVVAPDPPVSMQDATLTFTLLDEGRPVTGDVVDLDLSMVNCEMPHNILEARDSGDGVYGVQTVLTMAGTWRADVSFRDRPEQFLFYFVVK
jgi:hypothetical protein